jgi:membrane-associated phospholipid phosphatase
VQRIQDVGTPAATPATPLDRFARHLSGFGHPFVVVPCSVAAISILRGDAPHAAASVAALFIAMTVAVVVGVKAGRFNDFDVSERSRRPGFYVLIIGGTVALGFWLRDEPEAFGACVVAAAVLVVCGVVNRWMKPSLHAAFSLYAVGLWGAWSIAAGLAAIPVAAAIAWSRIRLHRHTPREVVVGTGIGLVAASAILMLAAGVGIR